MISAIFGAITSTIGEMVNAVKEVLTSVVTLIYTPGTSGAAGALTDFGTLVLIASGVGLVYWGFRLIKKLIRVR